MNLKSRNLSIDFARSIACLYIVTYWHLLGYFDFEKVALFDKNIFTKAFSLVCLSLFCFLSAYFIGKKEAFANFQQVIQFIKKRLLRLYPLYLLSIIAFWLLGIEKIEKLIGSTFFTSMFHKPAPLTLWFMTMILFLNFLSPIILGKDKTIERILIASVLTIFILFIYSEGTSQLDTRMILHFPAFCLGLIVGAHEPKIDRPVIRFITYLVFGISVLFYPLSVSDSATYASQIEIDKVFVNEIVIRMPLVASSSLMLFFVLQHLNTYLLAYKKIISFLSYSSFCMYLFHRPVYELLLKVINPVDETQRALYLTIVGIPAMIGVSWFLQFSYDYFLNLVVKKKQTS